MSSDYIRVTLIIILVTLLLIDFLTWSWPICILSNRLGWFSRIHVVLTFWITCYHLIFWRLLLAFNVILLVFWIIFESLNHIVLVFSKLFYILLFGIDSIENLESSALLFRTVLAGWGKLCRDILATKILILRLINSMLLWLKIITRVEQLRLNVVVILGILHDCLVIYMDPFFNLVLSYLRCHLLKRLINNNIYSNNFKFNYLHHKYWFGNWITSNLFWILIVDL